MDELGPRPLSRDFLLSRGYCCESGCLNCPYGFHEKGKGKDPSNPLDWGGFTEGREDLLYEQQHHEQQDEWQDD